MNILLISQFYSSGSTGGGDYVFFLIADMLAKSGHKVWIITTKRNDTDIHQHENIKFIFPVSDFDQKGRKFKNNILFTLKGVRIGLSLIRREKIDIIHSNTGVIFPAFVGSILSAFTSVPHIITIHLLLSMLPGYWKQFAQENSKINAALGPFFERMQIKLRSSALHTVHESVRDDLIKFGAKKKIYVIHNGIPLPNISNIAKEPLQFLYIGRLVFNKNIQTAIRAISIIKKKYPDVKLIIGGEGSYKNNLEKLTNELDLDKNIIFKGFVSLQEKNKLLESSQSLVLPSLREGFPMSILESLSFSTPLMVAGVRPMSDLIDDQKTGIIVKKNDEFEWAKAIEFMIQNPEKIKNMGKECKKLFEEKYTLELMEQRILNMYNELIKN